MFNRNRSSVLLVFFVLLFSLLAASAVSAADNVSANFTSNVTNGSAPLSVQFNDTSTGNATSWNWDFGDNATSSEQNPVHNYGQAGNYNVCLTVFNADGNSTLTKNNYISVYPKSIDVEEWTFETGTLNGFTAVSTWNNGIVISLAKGHTGDYALQCYSNHGIGYAGTSVGDFSNASNFILEYWVWSSNTGYGYTSAGISVVDATGAMIAGMQGSDYDIRDTDNSVICNRPAGAWVRHLIKWNKDTGVIDHYAYAMDGSLLGSKQITRTATIGKIPAAIWLNCRGYTVAHTIKYDDIKLTGSSANGNSPVNFSANVTSGSGPLDVGFTDQSTGVPISWSWNFGDGTTSTEQNPAHTYTNSGYYTVKLTTTYSVNGIVYSDSKSNYIKVYVPPVSNFTASTVWGSVPAVTPYTENVVQFNDSSVNVESWFWDFGDGTTSTEQNPTHIFAKGNYNVTLTVTNMGVNSTSVMSIQVEDTPVNVTNNLTSGTYYTAQTASLTSNDANATIYYTTDSSDPRTSGTRIPYTVPINLYNPTTILYVAVAPAGYRSKVYTDNYVIYTMPGSITATTTWGTLPSVPAYTDNTIQFTDNTTNATGWLWDFGDGTTSTEQNPTHVYKKGNYLVSLKVTNVSTLSGMFIQVADTPLNVTSNLTSGTYNTTQIVDLVSNDSNATIYYADDATDPRTSSTRKQYTGPISIDHTTTLRYVAIVSAGYWSPVYIRNYVIGNFTADSMWDMFESNNQHTGQSLANGPDTGIVQWTFSAGSYFYYASPVIGADGTIYIGSYDKKLYALNSDGSLKWSYLTGGYIYSSPTIGSDGTIYVGSYDKKLYALNPDGTLKWSYTTGNYIYSSATIGSDGTIYVGSYDTKLYALNPDGSLKWSYTTGNRIYSYGGGPAIGSDGTIYVGSYDKNLYALNPDGTKKWSYTTGNYIYGSPSIGSDGTIYIGSYDGKLYALNPDGSLKWTYTTGSRIYGSAAIGSDGTIYVGSYDKNLYALNPDGTKKWSYTTGNYIYGSPAIDSDGTIFIGSYDSKVYALNPDGTLKWSYTTGSGIYGSPAIGADGTLYIGSRDYKLYAFTPVDFSGNVTVGGTPLTVQFTDKSSGNPTSWLWDFGDGTNSTEQNPLHAYSPSVSSYYNVTLKLTYGDGSSRQRVLQDYIKVYVRPFAMFSTNATTGLAPSSFQFTDTSLNIPTSWFWDFGDGTNSTLQNPTHTYTGAGNYSVSLTVTNLAGTTTLTIPNIINVSLPPVPVTNFTANVTSAQAPVTVQFTDNSTGYVISSWLWDFGDGTNSTVQNPAHTYSGVGNYTVSLTAGNTGGNSTTTKVDYISVLLPAPTPNFYVNDTWGVNNLTVQFMDNSTYSPTSWFWDFGDGTNSTEQNPLHTYNIIGNYTVSLNASNSVGSNSKTITKYIVVLDDLTQFPGNRNFNIYVANDEGIRFDVPNGVSGGTFPYSYVAETYFVYFRQAGGGLNPIHISSTNGGAQVTTTSSQSGTFWITFTGGQPTMPEAILMIAVNGTIPDDFAVHITSSGYAWDMNPPAVGNNFDTPNIAYIVGAVNETFTKSDFIYGPSIWKPCSVENYAIYTGQNMADTNNTFQIMFIDLYVGALQSGIENGAIRVDYNFTNLESFAAFNVYGWYSASNHGTGIIMTNAVGSGYNVVGYAPVASFTANSTAVAVDESVKFTDTSSNIPNSWLWDFGDGSTSTEQNPTHTYTAAGIYNVSLIVTNEKGNNTLVMSNFITVGLPATDFTANATVGNNSMSVQFNDTSRNTPTSWLWDFGDGSTSTEQSPVHNYSFPGSYNVILTATNSYGNTTAVRNGFINIVDTIPNVVASVGSGLYNCTQNVVLTTDDNTATIYYYLNGNGAKYTGPITVDSNASLMYFAVDNTGNLSPMYMQSYTIVPLPVANFTSNVTSGFDSVTVQFNDTSKGIVTGWAWDFNNDGVIDSTEQNPTYTFIGQGNYTVVLTVTNIGGYNTTTQVGYITVFNSTVPVVNATPDAGAYNASQNVTLTADQPSCSIYYTTDGSDPTDTSNSNRMPYTVPIQLFNNTVLNYAAVNTGGVWSTKYSKTYVFDTSTPSVTVTPEGGLFNSVQMVTLNATDADTGVTTYYTTDGSDPKTSSTRTVYTTPITVNTTTVLRFIAVDLASNWSPEYNQTYVIDLVAPTVTPSVLGGVYNAPQVVSLTVDENATIYYSLNGIKQYTGPITIDHSATLSYFAVDTAGNWSPVFMQTYTIVSLPVANFTANVTSGVGSLAVQFTDTSSNNTTTWSWDFNGDGVIDSTLQNPTWTYTSFGKYIVTLTAANSAGNNTITKTDYISVLGPIVNTRTNGVFTTIQAAIDDVSTIDGDVLSVCSGNYTENVVVNKRLVLNALGLVYVSPLDVALPVFTVTSAGSGSTVNGFAISGGWSGVSLIGTENCTLSNDIIGNNTYYGVYDDGSRNNVIVNSTIQFNPYAGVVLTNGADNNTISNSHVLNNGAGVQIYQSAGNNVLDSTFAGNDYGVYLSGGSNNTIGNDVFTVTNPNGRALYLENGQGNQVSSNTITGGVYGIESVNDSQNSYIGNDISSTAWRNMYLTNPQGDIIQGNVLHDAINGLLIVGGSVNQLINNALSNCGSGMEIVNSNGTNVTGNNLTQNTFGIYLYGDSGILVAGNCVSNCGSGIEIHESSQNTIRGNNLALNTFGVYLAGGSLNTVEENVVLDTLFGGAGVRLENTTGNVVNNNSFTGGVKDFRYGVYVNLGSNNTISNNMASNNHAGVELHDTSGNSIGFNQLSYNTLGVVMFGGSLNSLVQNIISGNGAGIEIHQATGNNITGNNVTNNTYGLYLDQLTNSSLTGNNLTANTVGLFSDGSSGNVVYTNNFDSNVTQAYDNGTNSYDNGTVGNFYSDWLTTASRSVDGGSCVDHYPSTTPYT